MTSSLGSVAPFGSDALNQSALRPESTATELSFQKTRVQALAPAGVIHKRDATVAVRRTPSMNIDFERCAKRSHIRDNETRAATK
jgi:hypothetical protein